MLGEIKFVPYNDVPDGWAECNGQLMPVAANASLFSLIGSTYGGDGQTTFALPDMRGRNPIHVGNGLGLTPRLLGQRGGAETHTHTVAQMPAHDHAIQ